MRIATIQDAGRWDRFASAHPRGHLLQSWAWGALKAEFGWRPVRLALLDGEEIVAGGQILFRRGMGYLPKGPLLLPDSPLWPEWLAACRSIAYRQRAFFLRMEPEWQVGEHPAAGGVVHCPAQAIQPRATIHIDLRPAPDVILAQMKPKWRYNIRLAERKGVVVRAGGEADLRAFYRLSQLTAQRDGFAIHSEVYYRAAWRLLNRDGSAILLMAEHDGRPIASLMAASPRSSPIQSGTGASGGRIAVYLYGASSDEERNRMPNHLLQWQAMLWAKERGCEVYDLWGVPSPADADDQLPEGLLRFKEGFGGRRVQYAGAFDVVYQPLAHRAINWLLARRRRGPTTVSGHAAKAQDV
ncbi:MAG: peptidoglycan bridge formation glycyltransferase FemA/FemB family protein [Chloroflexi bacterium]|nr:peptidoglycan bridge formation glycyltransferase FemA/FemB family protein [Chloroflexota bacterium]